MKSKTRLCKESKEKSHTDSSTPTTVWLNAGQCVVIMSYSATFTLSCNMAALWKCKVCCLLKTKKSYKTIYELLISSMFEMHVDPSRNCNNPTNTTSFLKLISNHIWNISGSRIQIGSRNGMNSLLLLGDLIWIALPYSHNCAVLSLATTFGLSRRYTHPVSCERLEQKETRDT